MSTGNRQSAVAVHAFTPTNGSGATGRAPRADPKNLILRRLSFSASTRITITASIVLANWAAPPRLPACSQTEKIPVVRVCTAK